MFGLIANFFPQVEMVVGTGTILGVGMYNSSFVFIQTEFAMPKIGRVGGGVDIGTVGASGRNGGQRVTDLTI